MSDSPASVAEPAMLHLFKFRPLGDDNARDWMKEILEKGQFWCSKFWELNDPMEGVFQSTDAAIPKKMMEKLLDEKFSRVICSFSGIIAFKKPTLWGYYANGFKGAAIEIEVSARDVDIVTYDDDVAAFLSPDHGLDDKALLRKILTTKLSCWHPEEEYRFIHKSNCHGYQTVGQITAIHFGLPYHHIENRRDVLAQSGVLQKYYEYVKELSRFAKGKQIKCYNAYIENGKVVSTEYDPDGLP